MDKLNQKVSSMLALTFLFLLAFLAAWFVSKTGEDVIENAPKSKIFDPVQRNLQ